ncbi:peroxiredoxin family protein [Litorilituus lipolyticus]|uniref:Peroxiredoxin family protein n=1 Tax=Litorilituus lipolyticus TaxID=2491017 RepID=A0A502KP19_9GAMM|nr:peroxiredoxin family protein [Litorilituus lipolyticus]TPH13398.1 peroxiredoxin family protein [Litorilituus lipolyticus]
MNKMLTIAATLLLAVFAQCHASEKKTIEIGPKIGEIAPEIMVVDENNKKQTIKSLSQENGMILVFFRSADWCPFCKRHLIELKASSAKLNKLGYGVAALSYDSTEILAQFSQEHQLPYPLLSDQNITTINAYKIRNKQYNQGDSNYGIPYPGIVIIDNQGKVVDKYFYQGYKQRVNFEMLAEKLAK